MGENLSPILTLYWGATTKEAYPPLDNIWLVGVIGRAYSHIKSQDGVEPPYRLHQVASSPVTLDIHIIAHSVLFVKGFPTFSQNFFSRVPTPVLHSQWQAFVYGYHLPLTPILQHTQPKKSIGNIAQIWDSLRLDLCTNCEQKKCGEGEIIKIRSICGRKWNALNTIA